MTTEHDPKTLDEYIAKAMVNTEIHGSGADVATRYPCPFCGSANFADVRTIDAETEMAKEHVCAVCGRGARAIARRPSPGHVHFEIVQTRGDDPPACLPPMRRES